MSARGRYRKGYRQEQRSRQWLAEHGWLTIGSRGSHGLWDIVAIFPENGSVMLVQVKSNRYPTRTEMMALRAFPTPAGPWSGKYVHVWRDREKKPEIIHVSTASQENHDG